MNRQIKNLRRVLAKLGVQSAQLSPFDEMNFDEMFGMPDKIFMNPDSFKQIQKILKDKK